MIGWANLSPFAILPSLKQSADWFKDSLTAGWTWAYLGHMFTCMLCHFVFEVYIPTGYVCLSGDSNPHTWCESWPCSPFGHALHTTKKKK